MDNGNPYLTRLLGIFSASMAAVIFFSTLMAGAALFVRVNPVAARRGETSAIDMSDLAHCQNDTAEDAPLDPILDLPANLMPGNVMPRSCECSGPFTMSYEVGHCVVFLNGRKVYLGYEADRSIIARVSHSADNAPVGELVLAWGMPTGIKRTSSAIEVYWGKRSAYVTGGPFSPQSEVLFINYSLKDKVVPPWHGFTSQID
jgi:hypothetical protein